MHAIIFTLQLSVFIKNSVCTESKLEIYVLYIWMFVPLLMLSRILLYGSRDVVEYFEFMTLSSCVRIKLRLFKEQIALVVLRFSRGVHI